MPSIDQGGVPRTESKNIVWSVDPARKLLFIEVKAGVSDYDLLKDVPKIWQDYPDVIWFNTIVDVLQEHGTGNWSWAALHQIAQEWKAFALDRNPDKRVAILTQNYWLTQLVNKAFSFLFSGEQFRCFEEREAAIVWATATAQGDAD